MQNWTDFFKSKGMEFATRVIVPCAVDTANIITQGPHSDINFNDLWNSPPLCH